MELENQDEREQEEEEEEEEEVEEEDMEFPLTASYDNLGGSLRTKITSSGVELPAAATGIVVRQPTTTKPRYRECLKNHAVGLGGYAVDGCGEFMAAGAEGTLDALKCAACNCHRNFHRKETSGSPTLGIGELLFYGQPPHTHLHHQLPQFAPYYRTPSGYLHVVAPQQRPPLALPSTSGGGQCREEQEDVSNPSAGTVGFGGVGSGGGGSSSTKRFRTKFTQEQKERMMGLAERLGWRIQKHDEAVVQQFCNETGVKRHVLKVWMHNNKHTLGKKP